MNRHDQNSSTDTSGSFCPDDLITNDTAQAAAHYSGPQLVSVEFNNIDTSKNIRGMSKDRLIDMAASIKRDGLITPPILMRNFRTANKEYLCVGGHTRIIAMKELGYNSCPCIILPYRDLTKSRYYATIDNLIRKDLTIIEKSEAFKAIKKDMNLNTSQLAKQMGFSRPYTTNLLNIADWPEDVKELCTQNKYGAKFLFEIARKKMTDDEVRQHFSSSKATDQKQGQISKNIERFRQEHPIDKGLEKILARIEKILAKTDSKSRKVCAKFIRYCQ